MANIPSLTTETVYTHTHSPTPAESDPLRVEKMFENPLGSWGSLVKLGAELPDLLVNHPSLVSFVETATVDLLERLVPRETLEALASRALRLPSPLLDLLRRCLGGALLPSLCKNPNLDLELRQRLFLDQPCLERVWSLAEKVEAVAGFAELVSAARRAGLGPCTDPTLPAPLLVGLARLGGQGEILAARHRASPPELLDELSRSESREVRFLVAGNPKTPRPALEALRDDREGWVARAAGKNLDRSSRDSWKQLQHLFPRIMQQGGGKTPDLRLSPELFRSVARAPYEGVRTALSRHPAVPLDVKADLFLSDSHLSPSEGGAVLGFLADHPSRSVRVRVAHHPSCPPAVVEALSRDQDPMVRACVAGRRDAPAEVLERLYDEGDLEIRKNLARNEAAPAELLARMAGDQELDLGLMLELAQNQSSPSEVLETVARRRGGSGGGVGVKLPLEVRKALVGNRNASAEVLELLSRDGSAAVRLLVARNDRAPESALSRLAGDTSKKVREEVALNPSTPSWALSRLASDEVTEVREAALGRSPSYSQ